MGTSIGTPWWTSRKENSSGDSKEDSKRDFNGDSKVDSKKSGLKEKGTPRKGNSKEDLKDNLKRDLKGNCKGDPRKEYKGRQKCLKGKVVMRFLLLWPGSPACSIQSR